MLFWVQLYDTSDMSCLEISRISSSLERLIKDMKAVVKCYNQHGYDINKIRIFDTDKKLLVSYDL